MAEHNEWGKLGENKAAGYLEAQGYLILERNWRLKHKEIDIICTDGKLLIVVEVKTRNLPPERPEELLDARKRKSILAVADVYMRMKGIFMEVRFDLILVTGQEMEICHIPEAIRIFD